MSKVLIALLVLVLAMLACGQPAEEWQLRGWTVTPSTTPSEIVPTETVQSTQTPYIVEITNTPEPTAKASEKCVQSDVTVHLRPSANTSGYPIEVLANGEKVTDLGGRVGKWWFVKHNDNQGWINSDFLEDCK